MRFKYPETTQNVQIPIFSNNLSKMVRVHFLVEEKSRAMSWRLFNVHIKNALLFESMANTHDKTKDKLSCWRAAPI